MAQVEWFSEWFGEDYLRVYPTRDLAQARSQVAALLTALGGVPDGPVLDLGCGDGRHLLALREAGAEAYGLDLSSTLLARASDNPVLRGLLLRGDLRSLPLRAGSLALACSFFTSFGYLASRQEDREVLAGFCRLVRPGGHLFLDLANPDSVRRGLPRADERQEGACYITQRRRCEGELVVKEIEIRELGRVRRYREQVRLYGRPELEALADSLGMVPVRWFGDETGGSWSPEAPRLSLLCRRER